jgi:hypothetical protein
MAGMMSASIVVVHVVVGTTDGTRLRARGDVEVVVEVVVVVMDARIQEASIVGACQMEDGVGEMGGVEGVALLDHQFVGKRSSSHTGDDDLFRSSFSFSHFGSALSFCFLLLTYDFMLFPVCYCMDFTNFVFTYSTVNLIVLVDVPSQIAGIRPGRSVRPILSLN